MRLRALPSRALLGLTIITTMLVLTAGPSAASSKFFSKTTGTAVDAYWTQLDGTEVGTTPFGNVHIGYIYAYEMVSGSPDVFAYIDDFDCPEGQLPGDGHGFEEEPVDGCVYVGSRYGYGRNMVLTIDSKLTSATLTGSLVLESGGGHGGDGTVVGNPPVDMTWTGVGDLAKSRSTYRYTENGVTYSFTDRSSSRTAAVDGYIGAMSFDPDLSGGYLTKFSSTSKERIK